MSDNIPNKFSYFYFLLFYSNPLWLAGYRLFSILLLPNILVGTQIFQHCLFGAAEMTVYSKEPNQVFTDMGISSRSWCIRSPRERKEEYMMTYRPGLQDIGILLYLCISTYSPTFPVQFICLPSWAPARRSEVGRWPMSLLLEVAVQRMRGVPLQSWYVPALCCFCLLDLICFLVYFCINFSFLPLEVSP
jgi:hypothetical protein